MHSSLNLVFAFLYFSLSVSKRATEGGENERQTTIPAADKMRYNERIYGESLKRSFSESSSWKTPFNEIAFGGIIQNGFKSKGRGGEEAKRRRDKFLLCTGAGAVLIVLRRMNCKLGEEFANTERMKGIL